MPATWTPPEADLRPRIISTATPSTATSTATSTSEEIQ